MRHSTNFLRRTLLRSVGGTRDCRAVCGALPRYHPPWPLGAGCAPVAPSLGSRCRVYWPLGRAPLAAAFFRRLRGDLHVALAPGLTPSPGRSWLRTDATRPHPCLSLRPVYGAGAGAADRFSGAPGEAGAGMRGVTRMATRASADRAGRRSADYPAGSWAQRMQARRAVPAGRAHRAACPVAAGLESIYRPSTIREQDHNM